MRLSPTLPQLTLACASSSVSNYLQLLRRRGEVAVIGRQMLGSGTFVAAHAREASKVRSMVEFCSKLDGPLQEADETLLWIELLIEGCGITEPPLAALHREFDQITAIFTSIVAKSRKLP